MNTEKMKAIISTKYGGPEILKLQEVDKPIPKDNEILIKIYATSITTAETMMRTGYPLFGRLFMGLTKPKNAISGTGFAGTIAGLGKDVRGFNIGDKVFGESLKTFGTYAEYVCIGKEEVVLFKPNHLSYEELAVIGDGPITSYNFLKKIAQIKPGQRLLIIGASGSLGTAAIQIAKHFGAEVTGVCSTSNIELVTKLGADKVIDYTQEDVLKNEISYDIIFDTLGKSSFSKCKSSLTQKGIYLSPVLSIGLLFQMLWSSIFGAKKAIFSATGMLPVEEIRQMFQEVTALMKVGKLKSVIDKRYSLEEIPEAHKYIEKGHKRGNVVGVRLAT